MNVCFNFIFPKCRSKVACNTLLPPADERYIPMHGCIMVDCVKFFQAAFTNN